MAQPRIPIHELTLADLQPHLPSSSDSTQIHNQLHSILARCQRSLKPGTPAFQAASWTLVSRELLTPSIPFSLHELLFHSSFAEWDENAWGPPPVWTPQPGEATETNIGLFLRNYGAELFKDQWSSSTDPARVYSRLQRLSYDEPERYWPRVLSSLNIVFRHQPDCIAEFSSSNGGGPTGRWFPGATLNIAESCLMATEDGRRRDDRTAIVFLDEPDSTHTAPPAPAGLQRMSVREVRELARTVAAGLVSLGLGHGARVAVYLPMTSASVCAYLGIILAGSTVVSVAESFSAVELENRMRISGANAVITQDVVLRGGKALPLYTRVVEANAPLAVVLQAGVSARASTVAGASSTVRLRPNDVHFEELLRRGRIHEPTFTAPAVPSDSPCNVLFSSGTTGTPKAIPWAHTVPIKAAADAFFHQDVRPGDVLCWPTSLGWMMGPWLIFSALVNGASIALYQGNPGSREFLKFVQDARVSMLGVIPSLVRSWRAQSGTPEEALDWSAVRCFSSTGEASSPPDMQWLMGRSRYRAPVLEYCGGTEVGGAFVTGSRAQPQALSAFSTPALGARVVILNQSTGLPEDEGRCCVGECALMPRMLGTSTSLLNADNYNVYFKGMPAVNEQQLRRHGDEFERLPSGYFRAHGRVDDTMNLGGIKVSSVEIERICNRAHPSVLETAAIGVPPESGGPEELVVFVVLKPKSGSERAETLRRDFTEELRKRLNPLFKVAQVELVSELPRTATNKVLRRQLRDTSVKLKEGDVKSKGRSLAKL